MDIYENIEQVNKWFKNMQIKLKCDMILSSAFFVDKWWQAQWTEKLHK